MKPNSEERDFRQFNPKFLNMFTLCQYRKIRAEENRKLAKAARGVGLLLKHQKVEKKKERKIQVNAVWELVTMQRGNWSKLPSKFASEENNEAVGAKCPQELSFSAFLTRDTR